MMKVLYKNFDGLDVAFKGALPYDVLRTLGEAKAAAQIQRGEVLAHLGRKRIPVHVAETGMRGGYAFRFDTGPFGSVWSVADSTDETRWNLRASVHSLGLAQHGYEGVKGQLLEFLTELCAFGQGDDLPEERISRLDFCVDVAVPWFQPDPEHFVCHSGMTRRIHRTWEGQTVARGGRIESVTIGKMPGRQVIVYDKAREIAAHEKPYWWDFWGLDRGGYQGEVWRVEIRAGKAELDNWNLRTFANFERISGAVILHTLDTIRFTIPTGDSEASRWPVHPLWSLASRAAENALAPYSTAVKRGKVMDGLRAGLIEHFRNMLPGLIASYGHLHGLQARDWNAILDLVGTESRAFAAKKPKALSEKFRRAAERYAFIK
jgi:hypothetical protein